MRRENLRIGQKIVLDQVDQTLIQMVAFLMHFAQCAPQMAQAVEEEELPLNSAHIRAAGLNALDSVEQVVNAITNNGLFDNDEEVQEMLDGIQEALDECREDLTQVE